MTGPRPPLAAALLVLAVAARAGGADSTGAPAARDVLCVRYPTLALDRLAWGGEHDAPPDDPFRYDLDPRGESILLVRGERPAHLVRKEIPGGREIPMSRLPLVGPHPARFSPDGAWIYFTAARERFEDPPGGTAFLRAGVFRCDRDGRRVERILPATWGRKGKYFAVLFDVRPRGGALLVGTGFGLKAVLAPQGHYEVDLEEHDLHSGADRPLGARVPASAVAFYHRDGRGVFFGEEPAGPRLQPLWYWNRRTGRRTRVSWNADRVGRPAGSHLAREILPRHLGGFDEDDHPWLLVARAPLMPPVRLLPAGELRDAAGPAPLLVAIRGGRALLVAAAPGRHRLLVAPIDRDRLRRLAGEAVVRVAREPGRLLYGEADAASREALLRARGNLIDGDAPPLPRDLMVRYLKTSPDPETSFQRRVTVWERAAGPSRIEFVEPGEGGGEDEIEWLGFDGERAWAWERGRSFEIPLEAFERIRNGVSPYRLLLDPMGLEDPGVRFRHVGERDGEIVLAFAYDDGHRGELRLDRVRGLPRRIVTPLDATVTRLKPQLGRVRPVREIVFSEWAHERGRRIPRRILFDTGIARYELVVREILWDLGLEPAQFRRPRGEEE